MQGNLLNDSVKELIKYRHQGVACFWSCLLLVPVWIQGQACVHPPEGLVSWWRAENSADDPAGGNNGAWVNGAAFTPGRVGQAFNFRGTNHVQVPASPSLNVQSFTIETWIFPADVNVYKPIVEYAGPGGNPGVHLWHSVPADGSPGAAPGSLYANVGDIFGPYHFGTSSGVIPSNQWTHVALTFDQGSGMARLFVNGANRATTNLGSITPLTALPLNLGYRPSDGTHFVGQLDEVSIYNRALTASEIQAVFNAGSAGKCEPFIRSQPLDQSVIVGDDVFFSVTAVGTSPLSHQWRLNGTNIATATNSSFTLTNVQFADAGAYSVMVSNNLGSVTTSSNAILAVFAPVCVTALPGLVSWWRAEGNADDSASGNNGAWVNGPSYAPGKVRQAFNFSGTSHVAIPASSSLNVRSLTIEAWIFPADVNVYKPIVEYAAPGGSLGVHLWHSVPADGSSGVAPGSLYANVGNIFGPYHFGTSAGVILSNQWTHVALTFNQGSGIARLFVNGANLATTNLGSITPLTALPVNLGYRPSSDTHFVGKIDEVSIYNRALDASEIQALINANAGKCYPLSPAILTQPQSQSVRPGIDVTFNVMATGTPPLSYQWHLDDTNAIAEATNSSLLLTNVAAGASGNYTVTVSNNLNSVTSAPARLSVLYVLVYGNSQNLTNSQYTFTNSVNLQLQTFFTNGTTFYTLDGSAPSFASTQYSGPFVVTRSSVLRAIGYSADFFQSWETDPISLAIVPTYVITATTDGGGKVSVAPLNGPYASNSVVSVTATPSNGWMFLAWRGDVSGNDPTASVTMNRNKTVRAIFGTGLSTTVAGNGAITLIPAGGVYPFGTVVRLYAVPQTGNYFAVWGNAASGSSNPLSLSLTNSNPTVSSLFTSLSAGQFALTVLSDGFGQVMVAPQTNRYNSGATVTLTSVPNAGQQFISWSGDAAGTNSPLVVLMNQSRIITASFTRRPSLSVASGLDGLTEQGFRLTLTGEFGGHFRVDGSTDLLDWFELLTLTNTYGSTQFTDGSATNLPLRFYRGVTVP